MFIYCHYYTIILYYKIQISGNIIVALLKYFYIYVFCVVYIISVVYNVRGSITVHTTHSSTVIT